jgi:hypothetical protein
LSNNAREAAFLHLAAVNTRNGSAARCCPISDTIKGERTEDNEFCMDSANGTLVVERIGDELIENSDLFAFAGALMPGKISCSFAGMRTMEITQTMTPLTDADSNVL